MFVCVCVVAGSDSYRSSRRCCRHRDAVCCSRHAKAPVSKQSDMINSSVPVNVDDLSTTSKTTFCMMPMHFPGVFKDVS